MDTILADVRSGLRMLAKYPTLSLVAVLTLGLGIGLSTTVFCVVNGGLFKGLPFPGRRPHRRRSSRTNPSQNQPRQPISVQDLAIWQARQTSFEQVGAYGFAPVNLSTEEGRPERFSGGPADGRRVRGARRPADARPRLPRGGRSPGAEPVMLLGYDLWRDRYGSAPDIVGKAIRVNGVHAHGDRRHAGEVRVSRSARRCGCRWRSIRWRSRAAQGPNYQVVARLKPGVSIAQAKAQAVAIAVAARTARFPATNAGIGADVMPYARDDPRARKSTRCSTRCSAPASACC